MNNMRKLMESISKIEEGYFSRLSVDLDELYRSNPNTPDENLIAFVRRKHGDKAADFFRSQIESGEYEQSLEEGYGEETFDEMVDYWKQSLSSSIVSKGVFTQLYDAANNNIDELNSAIADQAYSIAETYHGSGEGIGSSDQNHFIMHIGQSLGIDDLFGWNKPKEAHPKDANWPHSEGIEEDRTLADPYEPQKRVECSECGDYSMDLADRHGNDLFYVCDTCGHEETDQIVDLHFAGEIASDEDMDRDKANRGAKYGKAIRGEGIEEGEEDKNLGPYEDNVEKWKGQTVKITGGEYQGETGKVVDAKWERNDTGSREGVYQVKLYSGPVVTLYLGEWTHDQIELAYDPTHRPDGKYDPELEEAKPAHWLADKDRPSAPKPDLSDIEYETCAECGVNGGHKDDCPKLGAMYKEGLDEIDETVAEWMKRLDRL